jgi:hypothetical protein
MLIVQAASLTSSKRQKGKRFKEIKHCQWQPFRWIQTSTLAIVSWWISWLLYNHNACYNCNHCQDYHKP